ncbi:MAG: amidase family protein, partial [Caulobacterales bacterium]
DLAGLRIGVPRELLADGVEPGVRDAFDAGLRALESAGAVLQDIRLPHAPLAIPVYYLVANAEASSNLSRFDGVRYGTRGGDGSVGAMYEQTRGRFGAEVKRRIMIGTYVLSAGYYDAYYLRAQRVRARIAEDFKKVFAEVDALLTPTTPSAAFALGEKSGDPVEMYLNDIFTVTANLAGIPGLSLPAGLDSQGLPLGLQVLGRPLDEETVFAVASVIEHSAAFHAKPERWWG